VLRLLEGGKERTSSGPSNSPMLPFPIIYELNSYVISTTINSNNWHIVRFSLPLSPPHRDARAQEAESSRGLSRLEAAAAHTLTTTPLLNLSPTFYFGKNATHEQQLKFIHPLNMTIRIRNNNLLHVSLWTGNYRGGTRRTLAHHLERMSFLNGNSLIPRLTILVKCQLFLNLWTSGKDWGSEDPKPRTQTLKLK